MSTIVYRISVLLGAILADVPVGTNLGLFWLLWALHLWSVPAQSGRRLPGACRRGTSRRRRATLWSGPGVWALGHPDPRAGVATGGPAGRPLARPSV